MHPFHYWRLTRALSIPLPLKLSRVLIYLDPIPFPDTSILFPSHTAMTCIVKPHLHISSPLNLNIRIDRQRNEKTYRHRNQHEEERQIHASGAGGEGWLRGLLKRKACQNLFVDFVGVYGKGKWNRLFGIEGGRMGMKRGFRLGWGQRVGGGIKDRMWNSLGTCITAL